MTSESDKRLSVGLMERLLGAMTAALIIVVAALEFAPDNVVLRTLSYVVFVMLVATGLWAGALRFGQWRKAHRDSK